MQHQDFLNSDMLDDTREKVISSYQKSSVIKTESDQVLLGQSSLDQIKDPKISNSELLYKLAEAYSSNGEHKMRIYSYLEKSYFCPSSPILASVPEEGCIFQGSPISCFLSEVDGISNMEKIMEETMAFSALGGGLGTTWSNFPSFYDRNEITNRSYPHLMYGIKTQANLMRFLSGKARKVGSLAVFANMNTPYIRSFISARTGTGSDEDLQIPRYVNHGVILTDEFMNSVLNDQEWHFRSNSGQIVETVKSRELFSLIITTRMQTGEPYIFFIDNANRTLKDYQKKLGLSIKTTNLCTEIVLPTGKDIFGKYRSAICNLCSLNLMLFDEYKDNAQFFKDVLEFMDNILSYFISVVPRLKLGDTITNLGTPNDWLKNESISVQSCLNSNHPLCNSIYSAYRSRDIGIGVFGLFSLLQKKAIAADSFEAEKFDKEIFSTIKRQFDGAHRVLCNERGECPDSKDGNASEPRRMTNITAIAPTVTITNIARAILGANTYPFSISPSIEPLELACIHKGSQGFHILKNEFIEAFLHANPIEDLDIWQTFGETRTVKGVLNDTLASIFQTPTTMDQNTIIRRVAGRQKDIDQSQSVNLFFSAEEKISNIIKVVFNAWKSGVKTLYYHRSYEAFQSSNTFNCFGCD